ncbi:MAG: holB [Gammaproteobacteria bacterium]|jgi:DNA polymerase-3 subunit delta'|nr:holB [Gammaproteobacteria bacterium]
MVYPWLSPYQQQLPSDRLLWPQALLLAGAADLGGLELAQHWAAFLLCHRPHEQSACGECQSCHWLQSGYHPDFFTLIKAEDEKFIKIDAIRDLIARLSKTAHSQAAQVILISPAESLNSAAANALLKSLEEPKARVHFLLIADHHLSLPKTLLSRCQTIVLRAPLAQSLAWLKTQFSDQTDENLRLVLRLERDLPLAAARTLAQNDNNMLDAWLDDCVAVALKQQNPLLVAQKWAGLLKEQQLRATAYFFLDIVRYSVTGNPVFSLYENRTQQIEQLATHFSLNKSLEHCQSLWALYAETIQGLNVNFQLALECRLLALADDSRP